MNNGDFQRLFVNVYQRVPGMDCQWGLHDLAAKVERAADDVLSLAGQICRFRGVELEDGAKTCEIYGFNGIQ